MFVIRRHDYSKHLLVSLEDILGQLKERIVSYNIQLCKTILLHDRDSCNWASKQPFYEV